MNYSSNKIKKKGAESEPFCIAVIGPTAIGKTDFAIALAKRFGGEIISADSRQVYCGLDIGSGKVTKREMRGVPHYLIDVADPKEVFSVSDFVKLAEIKIEEIIERGKIPIICGGTGLYVDTLLSGLSLPEVPPNTALRKKLFKKTAAELFLILKKLDTKRAKNIDAQNPVRLVRAIEIATALGKVPKITYASKYKTLYIGLDTDDAQLRSNIHQRLIKRIEMGMLGEVAHLHKKGVSWQRLEELGLEYRFCAEFLQKKFSGSTLKKIAYNEMLEKLELAIWQYAKRQRTWWKRNKEILWVK